MTEILTEELTNTPIYERRPAKIMVPLMPFSDNETLLKLARWLADSEPVLLIGVVPVPEGENLSAGVAQARELRDLIAGHIDRVNLRALARIRVSYTPWDEIRVALAGEGSVDLLVLNWPRQLEDMRLTPAEILSHPPCDVAILRGPLPDNLKRILVPMRGGPHAERALSLAMEVAGPNEAQVTALRLRSQAVSQQMEKAFAGMALVLAELPKIEQRQIETENQAQVILDACQDADLVILGTLSQPSESTTSFGEIADRMLAEAPAGVIAIKTKRVVMPEEGSRFGSRAISVLVDRWFAENTFHADEFADLRRLMEIKEERGLTISLALPSLNEEKTVGDVLHRAKRALMEQIPLLDEIVLMDSNSTDRTREIAANLGVSVYIHQEVLPQYGTRDGKGEALWKSLYVTTGDIIIWVDTDVSNFHSRFVYGLIGPFLHRDGVVFVKGFYRRPLKNGERLEGGRGGRVTELTARPLLNLFYPELSGIVQPLAGEYGGRREALEHLTFTSGYGVETGLLIDVFEKYKLSSIAQVDMVERIHRNQPLSRLSKMSFAIIQTFFSKLERRYGHSMVEDVNRTMKSIRYEPGHYYLEVEEIAELERPPMIEVSEYRQKRGLPEPEVEAVAE